MTEEQRQRAIRRIRAKREFRSHLAVYLAVNALLVLIWAMTSAAYFWPVWPMFGWGIGVVAHGVGVYAGPSEITEAQIERELHGRLGS
ncbi:MAG: 2TM domain-containing protein [Acidimicrobiia bacterium]|nr:2TM domain-containing protein [Acidimicrobiia bacterium]MBT8248613.1 2TM domain-containing protein [Acidimicrobiia bacterium]NNF86924.1 2TM domain-containing protein [Acidimicrobiia bacterium]NNJ46608.1 2TM domain-containing protein [Acidimicrobiia bacterium]NNL12489.1 2TM domain-containing protein [Acidimicrobiia bacterium]